MDFKKSLPRSFLKLVKAAKVWSVSGTRQDIGAKLHFARRARDIQPNCKIELAFVNVRQVWFISICVTFCCCIYTGIKYGITSDVDIPFFFVLRARIHQKICNKNRRVDIFSLQS